MAHVNPGELWLLFCPNKALWLFHPTGEGEGGGRGGGGGGNGVNLALPSWLHAVVLNLGFMLESLGKP